MKNYQYGENLSHKIYHFGDLWSTNHCYQLYLSMFGYILPFWYFPGWLGGRVGSTKIKDHLSPVEIEIGAELGKNILPVTFFCLLVNSDSDSTNKCDIYQKSTIGNCLYRLPLTIRKFPIWRKCLSISIKKGSS